MVFDGATGLNPSEAGGPPRVGIDGFNLAIPRGTGVATYARNLSHCVHRLGHPVDVIYGMHITAKTTPAMRTVAFFDQLQTEVAGWRPKYLSMGWGRQMLGARFGRSAFDIAMPGPGPGQVIAGALAERLPYFDRVMNATDLFSLANRFFRSFGRFVTVRMEQPPAVMHWTYPVPVTLAGAKNVYTIHDLVPLRLPYTTLDHKPTHFRLLKACLQQAAHICTVSEASRNDILAFFPDLPPERITNTYQAVEPPAASLSEAEVSAMLRGAFDLEPNGYFLFFGSIEPKKNIGRLLEGYLSTDIALPLVLVGARAWKSEEQLALLAHRPPGDRRVRQIEYLPRDVLTTLVRGARAVVFPSLSEGFGLPLLEAMSLGTPVLTSREGSLAEVGGAAALYVDAYDPRDIAAGLRRLAEDLDLCATLRAAGPIQAALFDMAHYETRVRAMYDGLLGDRRKVPA
jgi:glycosyltransferase involved in cell wall biosynthesis